MLAQRFLSHLELVEGRALFFLARCTCGCRSIGCLDSVRLARVGLYAHPPGVSYTRERRGGRAVECGGLENRCGLRVTGGSNPSLSASAVTSNRQQVTRDFRRG